MSLRKFLLVAMAVATLMLLVAPVAGADEEVFEFDPAVFDIAAAPDGSILVGQSSADGMSVKEIRKGQIDTVIEVETATAINGLDTIGRGDFFMTTAGSDRALDGELYRVSHGRVRLVADLAEFERENDPDAFAGPMWKDQRCEAVDGFNAGPQNNPFHVLAESGGSALVPDAAGNTLLRATTTGGVDWVAIFTPPLDETGDDWLIRFHQGTDDGPIPCYVQPVPTSVDIGPDGRYYVGELTGATQLFEPPFDSFPIGLSRVWAIDGDAENVVCSELESSATPGCEVALSGFTSVIDLAFGPDGMLYVVEYDRNSWVAITPLIPADGGTILECDLDEDEVRDDCDVVDDELEFPSAITFDKWGNLWLLEKNIFAPTVRMLDLD